MTKPDQPGPIDARRRTLIWKWFLNPETNTIPPELTKEELLGVYANSVALLFEFRSALSRLGGMYQSLKKQEFKKPVR